jgi:NTP pyrophosphatase (non-canonical NTP hydrolase)
MGLEPAAGWSDPASNPMEDVRKAATAAFWMGNPMTYRGLVASVRHDSKEWFPAINDMHPDAQVQFTMLALVGELGEAANLMKKIIRDGYTPELAASLREEVCDAQIYLAELVGLLDMDMEDEYGRKRAHNAERFGRGNREEVSQDVPGGSEVPS